MIYDDYAHHPTEILATLNAAKNLKNNIVVIFQPHRYTRSKFLMKEFVNVLSKIKYLFILQTYSAGEKIIKGATSRDIYLKVHKKNKNVKHIKSYKEISINLLKYTKEKNTIIFMGAGSISNLAKNYFEKK